VVDFLIDKELLKVSSQVEKDGAHYYLGGDDPGFAFAD